MTFPFPTFLPSADNSFLGNIQGLGLAANLALVHDYGSAACYAGSGDTISDLAAVSSAFYRGTTSGSESSDPTFNGTAGGLSSAEYFSFDGADLMRYSTTNPTWVNNLHKDNAAFSFLQWVYWVSPGGGSQLSLWGTGAGTMASVGAEFYRVTSERLEFSVYNGGGTIKSVLSDSGMNNNAWNLVGMSYDEAGNSFFYLNGNYNQVSSGNTFSGAYSSPSASNATYAIEIGARGNASSPLPNGCRLGGIMFWSSTLSKANFDSIWGVQRLRYGL